MDEGLVKIIVTLIGLFGTIITVILVPFINSKTTKNQRENMYFLISTAADAAEQLLKKDDPTGEKRRQYIVDYLNNKGIKISEHDLEVLREAAVKEINRFEDELYTPEISISELEGYLKNSSEQE